MICWSPGKAASAAGWTRAVAIIGVCTYAFSRLEPKAEAFEKEKKAKLEANA